MASKKDIDADLASCLPQEILMNIFQLLTVSDIKVCRCVCRSWAWSSSIKLSEASHLNLKHAMKHTSSIEFLSALSIATFKSLKVKKVSIAFSSDEIAAKWLWGPVLAGTSSLLFDKCCVTERDFIRILTHVIHTEKQESTSQITYSNTSSQEQYQNDTKIRESARLKSLSLIDTRELFMSGVLMSNPSDMEIGHLALTNVISLDISRNSYMTDILFQRLVSCMPKLETLILNETNIQHHPGIYKKFYPEHVTQNSPHNDDNSENKQQDNRIFNSPSIFTFGCLLQYLTNKATNIRHLSLQGTNLPDVMVQNISSIPQLRLNSLDISKNLGIKQAGMKKLAELQGSTLRELNVSFCRRIAMDYNPDLLQTFEFLSRITKLVLHGISCSRGFDECLLFLKNLEYLDITDCDIPLRHLADGIVKPFEEANLLRSRLTASSDDNAEKQKSLSSDQPKETLDCKDNTTTSEEGIASMSEASKHCCARKLQVLILSRYCRAPDQLVRILRWTSNLTHLNFNGCTLSQDAILQVFQTLESGFLQELNLSRCEDVGDLGYKLYLPENKSSAVTTNVLKMPEEITYKVIQERLNGRRHFEPRSCGGTIGDLKTITTLKICSIGVTDSTILDSFHFYDLRTIDVSQCENISSAGFVALAYQNTHIEDLTARSCNGLNDVAMISIACCLKRLIHLDIESSFNVTSLAITPTSGSDQLVDLIPIKSWFPNPHGLAGCRFLRFLNVSRCPEISLLAIDALLEKIASPLKVKMDDQQSRDNNREYVENLF